MLWDSGIVDVKRINHALTMNSCTNIIIEKVILTLAQEKRSPRHFTHITLGEPFPW
jgi:hypothetical protein